MTSRFILSSLQMCLAPFQADSSENTPNRLSIPTYITLCLTWVCCLHLRNRFTGLACVRALCSSALGPPFAAPCKTEISDSLSLHRTVSWIGGSLSVLADLNLNFWRVSIFGEQVFHRLSATLCSLVVMKLPQVVSLLLHQSFYVVIWILGYCCIWRRKEIHLVCVVFKNIMQK